MTEVDLSLSLYQHNFLQYACVLCPHAKALAPENQPPPAGDPADLERKFWKNVTLRCDGAYPRRVYVKRVIFRVHASMRLSFFQGLCPHTQHTRGALAVACGGVGLEGPMHARDVTSPRASPSFPHSPPLYGADVAGSLFDEDCEVG